jgi:uncharacterized protein
MQLSSEAVRVVGCLIEKHLTVPDTYPLTLNSVQTACNQTTNRYPVVEYSPADVVHALDELRTEHKLARVVHSGAGSRVDKHRHVVDERLGLSLPELSLLCVLALRGAQTAGELKIRTERMFAFVDVNAAERVLDRLTDPTAQADPDEATTRSDSGLLRTAAPLGTQPEIPDGHARSWDGPLVVRLPRQPGQKEERWMHLLGGPIDMEAMAAAGPAGAVMSSSGGASGRVAQLEESLGELQRELRELREEFDRFRSQFS